MFPLHAHPIALLLMVMVTILDAYLVLAAIHLCIKCLAKQRQAVVRYFFQDVVEAPVLALGSLIERCCGLPLRDVWTWVLMIGLSLALRQFLAFWIDRWT